MPRSRFLLSICLYHGRFLMKTGSLRTWSLSWLKFLIINCSSLSEQQGSSSSSSCFPPAMSWCVSAGPSPPLPGFTGLSGGCGEGVVSSAWMGKGHTPWTSTFAESAHRLVYFLQIDNQKWVCPRLFGVTTYKLRNEESSVNWKIIMIS